MSERMEKWFKQLSAPEKAAVARGRAVLSLAVARRSGETQQAHMRRLGSIYGSFYDGDPHRLVKEQGIGLSYRPAEQIKGAGTAYGATASGRGVTLLGASTPIIVLAAGLTAHEQRAVLLHELGHIAAGGGDDQLAVAFVAGWEGQVDDPLKDATLPPGVRWARWQRRVAEGQRRQAAARVGG